MVYGGDLALLSLGRLDGAFLAPGMYCAPSRTLLDSQETVTRENLSVRNSRCMGRVSDGHSSVWGVHLTGTSGTARQTKRGVAELCLERRNADAGVAFMPLGHVPTHRTIVIILTAVSEPAVELLCLKNAPGLLVA